LIANWQISKKWNIGFSWMFISGQPVTVPNDIFLLPNANYSLANLQSNINSQYMFNQGERNNFRMKTFHKLDISSEYRFKMLGLDATFNLGAYNIYNRLNSSFYYIGKSDINTNGQVQPVLKSVSLFPFIPSTSLKVKF